MKSYHFCLLAIISTIVFGCKNYPVLETERIEDNESFNLCEGCPSALEFSASIEFPTKGAKEGIILNLQENIISEVLGQTNSTDIKESLTKYKEEAARNYRESNIKGWEEFGSEPEWAQSFNWTEGINANFLPAYKNMQSYSIYTYGYTGGAHGIDGERAIVFNLDTGNIMTEGEIFKDGWEDTMKTLLTKHLEESFEDREAYDILFVKEISPNGNFYVTEKGITYIYGRYEIGPYVVGIVKVTIPWEELKDLIR